VEYAIYHTRVSRYKKKNLADRTSFAASSAEREKVAVAFNRDLLIRLITIARINVRLISFSFFANV
jgi:hypothetical protein